VLVILRQSPKLKNEQMNKCERRRGDSKKKLKADKANIYMKD
jgi:hypothetical protein